MSTLLHCGKRRHPNRRVDISAPNALVPYLSQTVNLKEQFDVISVYEFYCPTCLKAKATPWLYGWVGHYYNYHYGTTQLEKIHPKELQLWMSWLQHYRLVENKNGAAYVKGSQSSFPYRLMSKIPVY